MTQKYQLLDKKLKYKPLKVHPNLVRELQAIEKKTVWGEDARQRLGKLLQAALKLEFATVNPYLSAAFSIIGEENGEIRQLLVRIAKEEMLHLTVVANLMNAIGIAPNILDIVPVYPSDLTVLTNPPKLELRSFSFDLVENLFMRIEIPEKPVKYPRTRRVRSFRGITSDIEPSLTVGLFYAKIIKLIENDTIPDLFKNAERDKYKQIEVKYPNFMPIYYANDQDERDYPLNKDINFFVIKDKETASRPLGKTGEIHPNRKSLLQ